MNTQILRLSARDPRVFAYLADAKVAVVDGRPLLPIARRLATRRVVAVTGREIFATALQNRRLRTLVVGGPPGSYGSAAHMGGEITEPGPVWTFINDKTSVGELAIIFLALGSPKSDELYAELKTALRNDDWAGRRFIWCGVGSAAAAYLAGPSAQVPPLLEATGFGWAWRAAHEPARLLPRYAADAAFLSQLWRAVLRRG